MRFVSCGRLFVLMFTATAQCLAQISWDRVAQSITAAPDVTEIRAVFSFANTGARRVTITEVRVSCGCLQVEPFAKLVEPGEQGKISVTYSHEGNEARRESKTIEVFTAEGNAPHRLELTVDVPAPSVVVQPRVLFWLQSQEPSVKTVRIVTQVERGWRFQSAEIRGGGFAVSEKNRPGAVLPELAVTPVRELQRGADAVLAITFSRPSEMPKTILVPLAIK